MKDLKTSSKVSYPGLFLKVWRCAWCGHETNPELEIRCVRCGRKDD